MHQVDKKRKKTLTLRFIAYAITFILTIVTTAVLLFIALGYRFDRGDGDVTRSGLLLVDSKPEAGEIYINNELKDRAAPGRFILQRGNYDLGVRRKDYRDWQKNVAIEASGVREVNYPILIPNKLTPKKVGKQFTAPSFVSQSGARQYLLSHVTDEATMSLTRLDKDTPEVVKLPLSNVFESEDGKFGTFKLVEWALDGKHVLLTQTLPSGVTQLMSFDIGKPEKAVNITKLYGVETPTDVHYVGGNADTIYGLKDGLLRKQSLTTANIEIMLQNVRSYQPYGDDTILYESIAPDTTIQIGIMKNETIKIVKKKIDPSIKHLLRYSQYDKHYYFVVSEVNGATMTLYRDPLDTPAGAKLTPFIALPFDNAAEVLFSPSAQFITAQNGSNALTYDLRDLLSYKLSLPFVVKADTFMKWIDGFHLQAIAEDGTSYMLDYDGQNVQKLIGVGTSQALYFAPDTRSVFRINEKDQQSNLEETDLVTAADK